MPRIPLIKFPKSNLKAPSPPAPQPADRHATLMSRLGAKLEAPSSSGEIKNYRFRSDVPSHLLTLLLEGQLHSFPNANHCLRKRLRLSCKVVPSDIASHGWDFLRSINKIPSTLLSYPSPLKDVIRAMLIRNSSF